MASEDFETWRVVRENLMGGPSHGPEPSVAMDPFYEFMDCPKYVDFTQPDPLREEDLEAWFEVYVDREAGKPRSYPLFRDPAMDLALCEMEVERLLKANHSQGLRPLQTPSTKSSIPPRQRPISGGTSSPSENPPGSCSPNSVLRPSSYRRAPKLGGATSVSRSLDFGKAAEPTKRHVSKFAACSIAEPTDAPGMQSPWDAREASGSADVSRASRSADVSRAFGAANVSRAFDPRKPPRSADVTLSSESKRRAESRRLWPTSMSVDSLKRPSESKRTDVRSSSLSEAPLSEVRRASEPRSPLTRKRYMLPTATSIRKQDHPKPLRPSADGPGGSSPGEKPTWQPPSPVVRRTSPRHPTGQSSGRAGVPSKPPGEVAELRRACYLQKLGEERKAKLRVELSRSGPVGGLWGQQTGGVSPLPGDKMQERFDAYRQTPLVLAS